MRRTVNIKLSLKNRQYLEETVQQFKKICQVTIDAETGHGQLVLKSGTLKLNGDYSPIILGQEWSLLTIYLNSCSVEFNRYRPLPSGGG